MYFIRSLYLLHTSYLYMYIGYKNFQNWQMLSVPFLSGENLCTLGFWQARCSNPFMDTFFQKNKNNFLQF